MKVSYFKKQMIMILERLNLYLTIKSQKEIDLNNHFKRIYPDINSSIIYL